MSPHTRALAGVLLVILPAAAAGEAPAIRRSDAKAYRILGDTKRLPKLDAGEVERRLTIVGWRPTPRRPDDPALDEPAARLQVLDATCDADVVVLAHIASSTPFQHPNGRWVLTAHDLVVSRVVRAHTLNPRRIERVRYVHPSGELTIADRAVRTTLNRFPAIASDEEALFFLVRIGGGAYRTSLLLPPMAVRSGILDAFGIVPADAREPASGLGVREAVRAAADAVCRPAPARPERRTPVLPELPRY